MSNIQELESQLAQAQAHALSRSNEMEIPANIASLFSRPNYWPKGWVIEELKDNYRLTIDGQIVWFGSPYRVDIFRDGAWVKELTFRGSSVRRSSIANAQATKTASLNNLLSNFDPL